jgi:hypothetical protein
VQRRLEGRTNSIARQFDRICVVLTELGYLAGPVDTPTVTDAGTRLSRIRLGRLPLHRDRGGCGPHVLCGSRDVRLNRSRARVDIESASRSGL